MYRKRRGFKRDSNREYKSIRHRKFIVEKDLGDEEVLECPEFVHGGKCDNFKHCPFFHERVECENWIELGECELKRAGRCKLSHRQYWAEKRTRRDQKKRKNEASQKPARHRQLPRNPGRSRPRPTETHRGPQPKDIVNNLLSIVSKKEIHIKQIADYYFKSFGYSLHNHFDMFGVESIFGLVNKVADIEVLADNFLRVRRQSHFNKYQTTVKMAEFFARDLQLQRTSLEDPVINDRNLRGVNSYDEHERSLQRTRQPKKRKYKKTSTKEERMYGIPATKRESEGRKSRKHRVDNREYSDNNREHRDKNREYSDNNREHRDKNREYSDNNREHRDKNRVNDSRAYNRDESRNYRAEKGNDGHSGGRSRRKRSRTKSPRRKKKRKNTSNGPLSNVRKCGKWLITNGG